MGKELKFKWKIKSTFQKKIIPASAIGPELIKRCCIYLWVHRVKGDFRENNLSENISKYLGFQFQRKMSLFIYLFIYLFNVDIKCLISTI